MKLTRPLALALAAALVSRAAIAGEIDFPWDALPESFVGMQTGELQPRYTLRPHGGAAAIDAQDRGGPDFIYTLGAQVTMTPQSALDLYVTNAFSQSPAGDDLLFYPDKREPTLGVVLSYIPSGRGVGDAAPTYWPAVRPQAQGSRFAHGFTINSAHTLASDRVHTRRTARADGNWSWGAYYATDPDFQFEFTLEDYALRAGSDFRSEAVEGTRFMIGGRWQAMDEAYGHPLSLGFSVSGGRDFPHPEVGALYAEGTASKAFDWGEVGVNGRGAIYAASTLLGAGVSVRYELAPETMGVAKDVPVATW